MLPSRQNHAQRRQNPRYRGVLQDLQLRSLRQDLDNVGVTAQEAELERARKMMTQKVERLRGAIKKVQHDLAMCLAAAEDIQDDKEQE